MTEIRVRIFHTNDMHGRMDNIARLANFLRRLRRESEKEGWTTFYWDAGDAADRRYEVFSLTKGRAVVPILEAMGCTLQTVGNAITLPYGLEALLEVAKQASYAMLAANLRDRELPLPAGIHESVLVELPEGTKLGVFGLTAPWGDIYETFGLRLPDFVSTAEEVIDRLRRDGADLIIALSHLGLEDDRRLAVHCSSIDLIVGAHSHDTLQEGEQHGGVLIAQAGEFAQSLGVVDLIIDPQKACITSKSAKALPVPKEEPPDPQTLAVIERQQQLAELIKQQVIGYLIAELHLDHFAECPLGNLAADALRLRLNTDLALVSSGQFHRGLKPGQLTRGDLNAACFSSANPCAASLKGKTILAALERGLDPRVNQYHHHGYRGTPIGIPQISGLQVGFDPDGASGNKVRWTKVDGRPLDPERSYRLAFTDAEMLDECGYLQLPPDQPVEHEVPTILGEALEQYIAAVSPVDRPAEGRWVTIVATEPTDGHDLE